MDHKPKSRCAANEPVRVSSLDAPRPVAQGSIREMSDDVVRIAIASPLPIGSRIELESRDLVFRGTVIKSSSSMTHGGDAAESVSIRIEHETWNCGTILVRKTV